jgi:hypothetical protein
MTRESSKHGPRLDDAMAREGWAGASTGRADDTRAGGPDNEEPLRLLSGSDEIHAGSAPAGMTPAEREGRTDLGRYLPRSVFPTDRAGLLSAARRADVPDGLMAELERLEDGRDYATVAQVWEALGHGIDRRF